MEAVISSPVGNLHLIEVNGQLTTLQFTEQALEPLPDNALLQRVKTQLDEYFAGTRKAFDLPLATAGTEFQQRVWQELLKIPYGRTVSYQEIANRLGDPKCIRAAASANGKNPIAIIIPCHRVIGSDGSLTGYAGGLWRKKKLLKIENALIAQQIDLF